MRFDRLGPMLKIGRRAGRVALVGGGGGYAAAGPPAEPAQAARPRIRS